jgi:hypothetical protein
MIVGAIPSFAPITKEEQMVYMTVSSILTIPYDQNAGEDGKREDGDLPMPMKRLFHQENSWPLSSTELYLEFLIKKE